MEFCCVYNVDLRKLRQKVSHSMRHCIADIKQKVKTAKGSVAWLAIAPPGPDPSVRGLSRQKRVEIKGLPGIPSCPGAPQSAGAAAAVALLLLAPVGVSSARHAAAATYFVQHIFLSAAAAAGLARCPSRAPADPLQGRKMGAWGEDRGRGQAVRCVVTNFSC